MKKLIVFISLVAFLQTNVFANGITISNVSVINNGSNGQLKFDVSWENGWRSSTLNNWDAAWVFAKYKLVEGQWQHIYFTLANNIIPSGFNVSQPAGGEGSFLFRNTPGSGTTTITDVRLGIPQNISQGIFDIKVFAIEMVYIPQGQFYLGDGSGAGNFTFATSNTYLTPALVDNETVGANIYEGRIGGNLASLPAAFPKGYNAFYSMKYELSQAAYRDFLNTLSYTQQLNHTSNAPASAIGTAIVSATNRNYIEIKTSGIAVSNIPAVYGCDASSNNIFDETNDGEWVACNFLQWQDQAAYLAWAGLRPATEFEFEKMCRGILSPVTGEYAWGNISSFLSPYTLTTAATTGEIASNASAVVANANFLATNPTAPNNGPLRNGIFAGAATDRVTSGGGFYGVMELSGNVVERCVTTANAYGRAFNGEHGNGMLNANGYAVLSTWPGYSAGSSSVDGLSEDWGVIYKGGSIISNAHLSISSRGNYSAPPGFQPTRTASSYMGCRGVRIAP